MMNNTGEPLHSFHDFDIFLANFEPRDNYKKKFILKK